MMSAEYATTELSSPATTAYPTPVHDIVSNTGRLSNAATADAAAGACKPGSRAPTSRFSTMYAAQQPAASSPAPTPNQSLLPDGRTSTYTPAAAPSAHHRSRRVRDPTNATANGPRNSNVTARPNPIRSTAVYRPRFIVANTTPSSSVGHHCPHPNRSGFGRATGNSTSAATH